MKASVCIEQKGVVEMVSPQEIQVKIMRNSLCGPCSVKGLCFMGESAERMIHITDFDRQLKKGDAVSVVITKGKGNKAIILGYLLPFLLMLSVLITLSTMGYPEWFSGIMSLAILIPYFILLHLFKNRLNKVFYFSAYKLD